MDFLHALLVFLHILGAAAIVGGWLATFKTPTVGKFQWYGGIAQLVTGLLLVALAEMGEDPVNHAKIAVKLLLGVGVFVAALIGRRKLARGGEVSTGLAHGVGGLGLIAMAVAVLWQ
ncbi:hypothetical protein NCCP1664_29430 [Zafaria cholistanensis]|uniref:Integral membrane protein n=1 Tax=Zafaria cholistanensis TaxID=1682741 RepID=A0A5A7NVY9_9MICC|nr:hypothetical protein [Zafaria cholistanensis]GER24448.1 hypothetical protein NCCP1664_29430 [Zafaria cholistanensis]